MHPQKFSRGPFVYRLGREIFILQILPSKNFLNGYKLRATTDKEAALKLYPTVQKMLDKLAKTNIIHKNKAANLKSSLTKHIVALG